MNETRLFDQVKGLLGDLPYDDCLRMKEEHCLKKQSHKIRKERMKTPQPFELKRRKSAPYIVLIDDIYTTGRTLYYAQELF